MPNDEGQIKILDSKDTKVRVAVVAVVLCALIFGWFSVRWQLGNMLGVLTASTDRHAEEVAQAAASLAPKDPETNWLLAASKKEIFSSDDVGSTIANYKNIVRLSPFDYRWWIELGRTFEQADKYDEAEKAYLRSVELAPDYTNPRWQLGNFYLRRNRSEEAFVQLKKAAETNPVYRDQVFSLAWDYYDQDKEKLENLVGDKPIVKAGLARFYASKEFAGDALRVWNSLSPEDKQANTPYAKVIAQAFYEKRIYPQALEFYRGLGIEPEAKAENVQNGGFEKPIGELSETFFSWRVVPAEKMEVKLDPNQKRDGNRSLRVSFNGYLTPTLYNISQIVIVEPSAKYVLTFWLKTEKLKSGGNPVLEVHNPVNDSNIASSAPFPTDTTEWQQMKVEFTVPSNAQAVTIRTSRIYCGDVCPIVGTFWYDDFRLERIK